MKTQIALLTLLAALLTACTAVPQLAPERAAPVVSTVTSLAPTPTAMPQAAATPLPEPASPVASPTAASTQAALTPVPQPTATTAVLTCTPTSPDMLGPFYTPGAPLRDRVGEGYVLTGTVRSADGCTPIPGAEIEFWMAGPDGQYTNAYRASEVSGPAGGYRFQSHFPPPYSGRPSHIHLRVSAPGYAVLVTQHYPVEVEGQSAAEFDLVLTPE